MASIPPTTTTASGFCDSAPIFVEMAAGRRPSMAARAVITMGRTSFPVPCCKASVSSNPLARNPLKVDTSSSPFITATPRIEMNPTAAEMLK